MSLPSGTPQMIRRGKGRFYNQRLTKANHRRPAASSAFNQQRPPSQCSTDSNISQKPFEPIYSTFKPEMATVATDTQDPEELNVISGGGGKKSSSDFAQVSQDMNELVFHLNEIQNDISELAEKKRQQEQSGEPSSA